MTDLERVVKGLECCIESDDEACPKECPFYKECLTDDMPYIPVIRAALELLKKQEAKPPIVHTLLGVNYYYCPGCARPILKSVAEEQPRYCKDCGKGLKWYG